jgi:hypothetical protein
MPTPADKLARQAVDGRHLGRCAGRIAAFLILFHPTSAARDRL